MAKADEFRQRFKELYEEKLAEICADLNEEYDEVFFVRGNDIYVDCSDYSQVDVKIS